MYRTLYTFLFLFIAFNATAQTPLRGKVVSTDGVPVEGVNITIAEINKNTLTDEQGRFVIFDIPAGKYTLVASFTELLPLTQSISIGNTPLYLKLELKENIRELQAVVVRSRKGINEADASAAKSGIPVMSLPQSVAVVGEKMMRDQQAQRLSDVVKNVNGVYLSTTRGAVNEGFYARGYSLSSGNIFKNGSRINTGVMPEVSGLEKVEVLKGSAALLYGNVTPGGIINLVTRKPRFTRGGEVSLRTGSFGLAKPVVDVYGALNAKIAARLITAYETTDSYRDKVSGDRFYINPSLLFAINPKTELLLQSDYFKHDFTTDFGIGSLDNNTIPHLGRNTFLGVDWQYNKAEQSTLTATLKRKLNSNWSMSTTASFQRFNRDYFSTERIQAKADGTWIRPLNKIETHENYGLLEHNFTGNVKTGNIQHQLLVGMDVDHYHTTTYGFNNPTILDTINILQPETYAISPAMPEMERIRKMTAPVNRFGAYVQDLISLSPQWKLLAGVRYSVQNTRTVKTHFFANDSISLAAGKTTSAFSPRTGIVYQPNKKTTLFASYANSFSINNGTDVNGAPLDPSIIDQFELGIKNILMHGKLHLNITGYKIVNNNLAQTAPFLADGVTPNSNTALKQLAGQTTSNGIETDVQFNPTDELQITAGHSYNDMRFTKTPKAKGNYIEGDRLVNTPVHTANFTAFYTFTKGTLKNLKLGAGLYYTGDRIAGWNNTQEQTQQYDRQIPVKGFTLTDISAGYSIKHFQVLMKVSNLFDVFNYHVHENYSVNPIVPRSFTTTISYKF